MWCCAGSPGNRTAILSRPADQLFVLNQPSDFPGAIVRSPVSRATVGDQSFVPNQPGDCPGLSIFIPNRSSGPQMRDTSKMLCNRNTSVSSW